MRLVFFVLMFGCAYIDEDSKNHRLDPDQDGVLWPDDCDDQNQNIGLLYWYNDADGDGFGAEDSKITNCLPPELNMVQQGGDCNDENPSIYPTAKEICDGLDNDCDDAIDNGAEVGESWYRDADGDGYGDRHNHLAGCAQLTGYVLDDSDCDDSSPSIFPDALETVNGIDDDCDGNVDEDTIAADDDGDGYSENDGDCDDADADIHPSASDTEADGVDQNCDGIEKCFEDLDGDGDGNNNLLTTSDIACTDFGHSRINTDCDDTDADTYAGAAPQDSANACMKDSDGDGYGDKTPPNSVVPGSDCHDQNNLVHPGATELPADGVDQDCNGIEDCFVDSDGDFFGSTQVLSSTDIDCYDYGEATNDTDCDDNNIHIHPATLEVCDALNVDENCDGFADDNDANTLFSTKTVYYDDDDGDGLGDGQSLGTSSCDPVAGMVDNHDDCDDNDNLITTELGSSGICAASSCLEIITSNPAVTDGLYWIDPDASGAFESYCDMTTDGGGWTLFGNIVSGGFDYATSISQNYDSVTLTDNFISAKPENTVARLHVGGSNFSFDVESTGNTGFFAPSVDQDFSTLYFSQLLAQYNTSLWLTYHIMFSMSRDGFLGGSMVYLYGGFGSVVDGYSFTNAGCPSVNLGMLAVIQQSASGGYNVKNTMDLSTHYVCNNTTTGVQFTTVRLFYR